MSLPLPEIEQTVVRRPEGLPGYELLDVIGAGATGTVFRARQLNLDRLVAVKVVQLSRLGAHCPAAQLETEARALARFHHPGIVQVHDSGRHEDRFFIAMELLEGEDLGRRLRRDGPLPERLAWGIARQAAAALAHAAEQGVIHRDVKPANLFLATPPSDVGLAPDLPLVKVMDFGLARIGHDGGAAGSGAGLVMGTPVYMAPEQYRTPTAIDHRADLYALGSTVYHALTGRPPFSGASVWEVMAQKAEAPTVPPSEVTPESARLLRDLLAAEPERRLASYAELIGRIDALLAAPAAAAPAPAPEPPSGRFRRLVRKRSVIAAALAAVVTAAALLGWLPSGRTSASGQGSPPELPAYHATGRREAVFAADSMDGWLPTAAGGLWQFDRDDEGVAVLVGSGSVRRAFRAPANYRLTLGLDLFKAAAAEVHFAIPQQTPRSGLRLVLRVQRSGAVLGQRAGPTGDFNPLSSAVPFPPAAWFEGRRPYLEVRMERTGPFWTAWFNGKEAGRIPDDGRARSPEVQLWAEDGPARIDSAVLEALEPGPR